MIRQIAFRTLLLSVACLVLASAGCSATHNSSRTRIRNTLCGGDLDECRAIQLSCDKISEREGLQLPRDYEQLTLTVSPRECLRMERPLKIIELKLGLPRGQLCFKGVEARTDRKRQKVWFFERETGRIIATFDRETGETTGPDDEPPTWATPDGGAPL
jgi:hypothetical protein